MALHPLVSTLQLPGEALCVNAWERGRKGERWIERGREWLCFWVNEHIGPFLTTVTRRQYRVRTEMSSYSQNSPSEAMRPPPLTLACIPVGRHTVVGSDTVPGLARDKTTWGEGGFKWCNVAHFTADNCTPIYTPLLGEMEKVLCVWFIFF